MSVLLTPLTYPFHKLHRARTCRHWLHSYSTYSPWSISDSRGTGVVIDNCHSVYIRRHTVSRVRAVQGLEYGSKGQSSVRVKFCTRVQSWLKRQVHDLPKENLAEHVSFKKCGVARVEVVVSSSGGFAYQNVAHGIPSSHATIGGVRLRPRFCD